MILNRIVSADTEIINLHLYSFSYIQIWPRLGAFIMKHPNPSGLELRNWDLLNIINTYFPDIPTKT